MRSKIRAPTILLEALFLQPYTSPPNEISQPGQNPTESLESNHFIDWFNCSLSVLTSLVYKKLHSLLCPVPPLSGSVLLQYSLTLFVHFTDSLSLAIYFLIFLFSIFFFHFHFSLILTSAIITECPGPSNILHTALASISSSCILPFTL